MTKPQSINTKVRITVDHGIVLEVDVPRTMTATEWAGLTTRLQVLKSLARSDIMSTTTTRKMHKWTDEEKSFIKKNPKMKVKEIKKALKLEHMGDGAVYATMKTVNS